MEEEIDDDSSEDFEIDESDVTLLQVLHYAYINFRIPN